MKNVRTLFPNPPQIAPWIYHVVIMGVLGIIMYVTGTLAQFQTPGVGKCVDGIGLALFCSAVAALFLERVVHVAYLTQTQELLQEFRELEQVRKGAEATGMRDIVGRRHPDLRQKCDDHVFEAFTTALGRKTGVIYICCVAAPDYFLNGSKIGHLLFTGLTKAGNSSRLRVLLLNPHCAWAKVREKLEPGHPVIQHIHAAMHFLEVLKTAVEDHDEIEQEAARKSTYKNGHILAPHSESDDDQGPRVQYQFFDGLPTNFLIITDEVAFQEAYPVCELEPEEVPLGGRTPLLLFNRESDSYYMWRKHFDYLWKMSEAHKHPDKVNNSGAAQTTISEELTGVS
jgi:hypothetical protein